MLRGRDFGPEDVSGRSGTVVIDELAAQKFFPGADPIGKQIDDPVTITDTKQNGVPLTIIGIVPHTRNNAPGENDDPRILARDGLVNLGYQPLEAEQLLDGLEGEDAEQLLAGALRKAGANR